MLNSFVREFLSLPKLANQVPPRRQIAGAMATVSTLESVVGHPNTPWGRERESGDYNTTLMLKFLINHQVTPVGNLMCECFTYVSRKRRLESGFSLFALKRFDEGCVTDVAPLHHKHVNTQHEAHHTYGSTSHPLGPFACTCSVEDSLWNSPLM